jgi:hypothetical protein
MGCTNSALRENGTAKAGCPTSGAPDQGEPAIPLYNSTQPRCAGSGPVCSDDVVEQPADLRTLDDHYVRHVSDFLALHAAGGAREGRPFFAYVPFSHVHVPLSHNPRFQNKSKRNTLFADTLLEMDDTFGRIMARLEELKLDEDTLVLVVGDNGARCARCARCARTRARARAQRNAVCTRLLNAHTPVSQVRGTHTAQTRGRRAPSRASGC